MQLAKQHSPKVVAQRTGIDLNRLRHRLRQTECDPTQPSVKAEEPLFIEVPVRVVKQALSSEQPVSMRVRNTKGMQIDLTFTGGVQEVFPFMKELLQEG